MKRGLSVFLVACVVLMAVSGCPEGQWSPDGDQKGHTPTAPPSEIVRLVCAFNPPYWKNYRPERRGMVEGFKFNLYMISRKTGRGVHTTGMLHTRMFIQRHLPDGSTDRVKVCDWTQDLQNTPRTLREFELGWAYQPHYFWGDADVQGKEIEIVVWYETPDGRKIYATPQFLKVPAAK